MNTPLCPFIRICTKQVDFYFHLKHCRREGCGCSEFKEHAKQLKTPKWWDIILEKETLQ